MKNRKVRVPEMEHPVAQPEIFFRRCYRATVQRERERAYVETISSLIACFNKSKGYLCHY